MNKEKKKGDFGVAPSKGRNPSDKNFSEEASFKEVTTPEKSNSKDNSIKARIPDLNAEKINKFVEINAQILGEVKHKALPGLVEISCSKCDEKKEVDIRNKRELIVELMFSKKNTKTVLSTLSLDEECPKNDEKKVHFIDYEIKDYIDYALLQVRDVIRHDAKYNIQDYKPKWVHLVDHEIPDAKKISLNGVVVYDDTPQKRNIELISDTVEPLEDELTQFQITGQDKTDFTTYFNPIVPINQLAPEMVGRDYVKEAMLLLLHSPPYIPDIDTKGSLHRGLLRFIFIGDTKTNKSTAAKDLTPLNIGGHYPFGEFISAETGTRTGILYTIDNDKKALSWGSLVLNDMGLVILDGMHSLHSEEVKGMREVLEQLMVVVRRSVSGDALARTRIIGIINPKKPMNEYLHLCEAIKDTWVFNDPVDITRWDLFLPFKGDDVDIDKIIAADPENRLIPDEIFTRHVYWSWTRKPEHIIYPENIKDLLIESFHGIKQLSTSELPLVHPGVEYTILRLSVAYACLMHSTDNNHERILVKEEHVKLATDLLKENFKRWELGEYIERKEGKGVERDFIEILSELDELGFKILFRLHDSGRTIRDFAAEFDVSKTTIQDRYSTLKKHGLIDTSTRPAIVTTAGIKFIKSITQAESVYSETLSGVPDTPDKNHKLYNDGYDLSGKTRTPDKVQQDQLPLSENGKYYDLSDEELQGIASTPSDPRAQDAMDEIGFRQIKKENKNNPATLSTLEKDILDFIGNGGEYKTLSDISRKFVSTYTRYSQEEAQNRISKLSAEGLIKGVPRKGLIYLTVNMDRILWEEQT